MNTQTQLFILLLIILFSFILCSFLGNKSYNNIENFINSNTFYGPDGGTARIIETGDGNQLVITFRDGKTDIYYINNSNSNTDSNYNINTYYGPNGSSAEIITGNDGKTMVEVTTSAGNKVFYYTEQNKVNNMDTIDKNIDTFDTISSYDTTYYNSLPPGVPKSQIPPGDEDLYILKSQVVPPVCPRCPEPIVQCPDNFDATKCPPCPPCARCPEPAFECQKVPNYKALNPDYMPIPVLSDFSAFGM
jgi:hypothetical protein